MRSMRDSFTYADYRALLERLSRTHVLVRFFELRYGFPSHPFFILRHDVDYSPGAAIRMATLEAEAGWRATYFLLPNGPYYNLLDPEHAGLPRRLVELGHEVGLHYDVRFLRPFPRGEWDQLLDAQARLLAALSGQSVSSIAMHQPALNGEDPFALRTDYLNAYHPQFIGETTYVSDSCRAWRDRAWQILSEGPLPERLQICLHPLNWAEVDRSRDEIFAGVHRDLVQSIDRAHADLMEKVAEHGGVREHDTRSRRLQETARDSPR
jgi:hypothetical protein